MRIKVSGDQIEASGAELTIGPRDWGASGASAGAWTSIETPGGWAAPGPADGFWWGAIPAWGSWS
jgi:hypothetical protein